MSNHAAAQAAFPSRWFDFPSFRFFVIAPVFRHCAGFSSLRQFFVIAPVFRHRAGFSVIPIVPVIPAKAGIYALRWTPIFARATNPHRRRTGSVSKPVVYFFVIPVLPSFRRKPESTHYDGLRFSPEQRIHTAAARAAFPSRWFIFSSFRRFPVIPAKAGIYALR